MPICKSSRRIREMTVDMKTEYVLIERINLYALLKIIGSLAFTMTSIIMGSLLYAPIFYSYMPAYRDSIAFFLLLNFVAWVQIFVNLAFKYEPSCKKIYIRKEGK